MRLRIACTFVERRQRAEGVAGGFEHPRRGSGGLGRERGGGRAVRHAHAGAHAYG
jgi:hypothetical protein